MKTGANFQECLQTITWEGVDINGRCLLGRVIDRANFMRYISLIIATSNDPSICN